MRPLLLLLVCLLTACASPAASPPPTAPPAPTVPLVGEVLAAPTPGPLRVLGYLTPVEGGAVLTNLVGPSPANSLWLEGVSPAEPAPTLVEARGQLEGPGRFGPAGRYSYRLAATELRPQSVRDLSIPLLLENGALYEGQVVRLRGQLLRSANSALLTERIGQGGVPASDARQVKLAALPSDLGAFDALRRSPDGALIYGPVEITGLWRSGSLTPLTLIPSAE